MGKFIRHYDLSPLLLVRDLVYVAVVALLLLGWYIGTASAGSHAPQQVQASFYCYTGSSLDAGLRAPGNGEVPLVSGVGKGGVAMLIYVNPETKAWSFVIMEPNGRGCLVAYGEDFETADTDMFRPKSGGI